MCDFSLFDVVNERPARNVQDWLENIHSNFANVNNPSEDFYMNKKSDPPKITDFWF